ncbi:MAG: hypothetical protein ACWIPI_10045 [Polaribacter sp.]
MAEKIIKIESISQLHQMMGFNKPTHPLISVIDVSKFVIGKEWVNVKTTSNLLSFTRLLV